MRAACCIACAILLAVAAAPVRPGAEQRQDSGAASGKGAVIRGRVLAGDTGMPIRDAAVALVPAGGAPSSGRGSSAGALATGPGTTADDHGRFEIGGIPAGDYRIHVSPGPGAAQYLPGRFPDPVAHERSLLTVAAGDAVEGLDVRLLRAAVITGRVVDEHGSPLARTLVSAVPALAGNRFGRGPGQPARSPSWTDDTGSFRLFGLSGGEYLLHAQPAVSPVHMMTVLPTGVTVRSEQSQGTLPLYYPGTTEASQAMRIRVAPGEVYGPIEFSLHRVRFHTVRGVLVDPMGQPVPLTNVQMQPRGTEGPANGWLVGRQTQSTGADGSFEFVGVPPAEYAVSGHRFEGGLREFAWMPLSVFDDVDGLVVRFSRAASVKGRLLFEGRAPDSVAALQVRAVPGGGSASNAFSVQPRADGSFLLEGLFGPTLVRADGLAGWHLQRVLYGGRDITDEPTEFAEDGAELQVVLTDRTATLRGVVRTRKGTPTDGAVLVFAEDQSLWHERFTTTRMTYATGGGVFRLEGLRAGRYLAVAIDRDNASLRDTTPEYFELLARLATSVSIADGEAPSLDLTLMDLLERH